MTLKREACTYFRALVDTEMMTIVELDPEEKYSSKFIYINRRFVNEMFSLFFNLKLNSFLQLSYRIKSNGRVRSREPISLNRLFDLDKIMELDSIFSAIKIHSLYELFKQIEENLRADNYQAIESNTANLSNKLKKKLLEENRNFEEEEREERAKIQKNARNSVRKFGAIKIYNDQKFDFHMSGKEIRYLILTSIDYFTSRPEAAAMYSASSTV